ncbi:MAG TPA: polysaccharide deacetylase family protein, partial [Clostridiales bacterium]|nr:polysaccharide deacetylase family protein [Clostridiales bacterium]
KYLVENGYETVLIEDLLSYINDDIPLPENPVVITFDDGYYNNMVYLLPLLEKYDMRAIISIVGSYSERDSKSKEQLDVNYSYLTWEDISALNKTGLIEICNQTYDLHTSATRKGSCIMNGESEEQYKQIFENNVRLLQSELFMNSGVMPITFTYPYDLDCKESVPILKELGFKATFTCHERHNYISKDENSLYGLNRYNRPNEMTTEEFMSNLLAEK